MRRERQPELMDRPDADAEQLGRSLRDLAVVNFFLGGRHTAVNLVLGLARQIGGSDVSVLDVGTGGADIPRRLVAEARRRGIRLRVVASDLHATTLAYARAATAGIPEILVQPADALSLPFADDSFDVVTCSTTLHHFEREEAAQALREMVRVASRAVVVTDLSRSAPALAGAHLLAITLWRNHPITRHDGPTSVRAAFTPEELLGLAREITPFRCTVKRHPLFRLSLIIDKSAPRDAGAAG